MASYKSPPQFTAMTSPTGLNLRIDQMATAFNAQFNSPTVYYSVFHQIERKVRDDGTLYPAAFNENGVDELNLTPTDSWDYLFFEIGQPLEAIQTKGFSESKQIYPRFRVPISIVGYQNLDRLGLTSKWTGDFRIQKEVVRERYVDVCLRHFGHVQGTFTLEKIWDRQTDEIFKGYDLKEKDKQFMQQPFYGIRIDGTLIYKEPC